MNLTLAWSYFLLNTIASGIYFWHQWQLSVELYWSMVAMLNAKPALCLVISQAVSMYCLVVVILHSFVFEDTREGERFVNFRFTQQIVSKAKFKLMTLSITLVYLFMSFDYTMVVTLVFFMTAWIFTWYM
jgi:hypothetical protein